MNLSNFGAVRHSLLSAAVLAILAAPSFGQMVEKERTFADLTSSHPCSSGYTGRNAIVTDCDAADDIGDGGGAFRCFAHCDGTAPWEAVSIGGGGTGGTGDVVGPASSIDNGIVRFDSTTGKLVQDGSKVTLSDVGDIQWEGTADAFEGNFTFADPTADWTWAWGATGELTGSTNWPLRVIGNAGSMAALGSYDATYAGLWLGEATPATSNYVINSEGTNTLLNIPSTTGFFAFYRNDSTLAGTIEPGRWTITQGYIQTRVKVYPSTEVSGAPYLIPTGDTYALQTNEGATAKNYETLPTALAGLQFEFCVQDSDGIRVVANTGDTIRRVASVTSSGGYIESTTIGSCLTLKAINATEWMVTATNDLAADSWSFN